MSGNAVGHELLPKLLIWVDIFSLLVDLRNLIWRFPSNTAQAHVESPTVGVMRNEIRQRQKKQARVCGPV
jgi:hypothetical protein